MLEAKTNFCILSPPSFLPFFNVFSQPLLSGFDFIWRWPGDFLVFGFSLTIFFMGNNGGILKVKQIGKNLVSGLIIVNMLKKKKDICEDLIPFNTSGIFFVYPVIRGMSKEGPQNASERGQKAVNARFKCTIYSYTILNCDINFFW